MAHVFVRAVESWHTATESDASTMPAEMLESGAEYQLIVAVPGCDEKHLRVFAAPHMIAVEGTIVTPLTSTRSDVLFTEFAGRKLARSFEVQEEIAPEDVRTHLHNGLLTVIAVKARASRLRRIAAVASRL